MRRAWWEDGDLVVEGWAFVRGVDYGDHPAVDVWLTRGGRRARVPVEAAQIVDTDVRGAVARAERDHACDGFSARIDRGTLASLVDGPVADWRMHVAISGHGVRSSGPVRALDRAGSPVTVPWARHGNRRVGLRRHARAVVISVHDVRAELIDLAVVGRRIELQVTADEPVTGARLEARGRENVELTVARAGRGWLLSGVLPPVESVGGTTNQLPLAGWRAVVDLDRPSVPVVAPADLVRRPTVDSPLLLRADRELGLEVHDVPTHVEVTGLDVVEGEHPTIRLEADVAGDAEDLDLELVAPRLRVPATVTNREGNRISAEIPLLRSAWGGPPLPLRRGTYSLVVRRDHQDLRTFVAGRVCEQLARVVSGPRQRLRIELDRHDQLRVRVTRPHATAELGSYQQARLFERYAQQRLEPLDAVYLESFCGRAATCNPRAVDREIARRHPGLARYWAVDDFSIAVPDGATAVVVGSEEWWRVRESARWVVTNEWLRAQYVQKPYQTVLQTWHGSMYKRIGLDRSGPGRAHLDLARRERAVWDLFVSQNADTTGIIRRAYAFGDGVIETGYPRNDELLDPDPGRADQIRRRVGIPPGTTVVMYAPTWREVGQEVDLLDVVELARRLGPGYTVLQRGHLHTLSLADSMDADGVIDVGTYPQVNDLYLVTDLLVTDYSSMMFDFTVTRKPILFFTPDAEEYTDPRVRGVYFDLAEIAPGPVVTTPDEVLTHVADPAAWSAEYAERYDAWSARFNHADDGKASARVVDALFAFDPLAAHDNRLSTRFDADPGGVGEDE